MGNGVWYSALKGVDLSLSSLHGERWVEMLKSMRGEAVGARRDGQRRGVQGSVACDAGWAQPVLVLRRGSGVVAYLT
jgi:hypothetical protein